MLHVEEFFESVAEVIEIPEVGCKKNGFSDQGWSMD